MDSVTLKSLEADILADAEEDYLGLWVFLWHAREDLELKDVPEVRAATMEIVSHMLKDGLISAGEPKLDFSGFIEWDGSAEEIVARIEREWDELDHEPSFDDIVWFDITEKGRAYLDKLLPLT